MEVKVKIIALRDNTGTDMGGGMALPILNLGARTGCLLNAIRQSLYAPENVDCV
jgi:hypothetical protein